MLDLPSGTVTFLFTDIEGSTARWERNQAAMRRAVDRHLELLDAANAAHGGYRYQIVGDGMQAAIATAPDALSAAVWRGGITLDCPREDLMEGAAPFLRRAGCVV